MSQHTPGPWQSHDDDHCPEEIWGALEGPLEDGQIHGIRVCEINTEVPNWQANARIIKASLDLLEACKKTLYLSDHAEGCKWFSFNISEMRTPKQQAAAADACNCHLAVCRKAVAKAEETGE